MLSHLANARRTTAFEFLPAQGYRLAASCSPRSGADLFGRMLDNGAAAIKKSPRVTRT